MDVTDGNDGKESKGATDARGALRTLLPSVRDSDYSTESDSEGRKEIFTII